MRVSKVLLCVACLPLAALSLPLPATGKTQNRSTELTSEEQRLVAKAGMAACDRSIVLIGEPTHGGGRTELVKTALVKYLHTKCGFTIIAFEASAYEFISLQRAVSRGERDHRKNFDLVSASLGMLWNRDEQFQELIDYLSRHVSQGKLRLFGIDYQGGGRGQPFSNGGAFSEITDGLRSERREECRKQFAQKVVGDSSGFPTSELQSAALGSCVREASRNEFVEGSRLTPYDENRWISINMSAWLAADELDASARYIDRDRQMAENVKAIVESNKGKKVVVWTHNIHASRTRIDPAPPSYLPMGAILSKTYGNRLFSLGITAKSGSYRSAAKTVSAVPAPAPGALEATAEMNGQPIRYIGRAELERVGRVPAGFINFAPSTANWADAYDGVLVMTAERPTDRLVQ